MRRALPTARVGGPDTAGSGGKWMRSFLEHCLRGANYATGGIGTPLDFVSFHAEGSPRFVDGHVRMGIAHQLRTIEDAFRITASYPELKDTPVVIGESDPEGCAACQGPQLAYRIDADHSNAFAVWSNVGSPQDPNPRQYDQLVAAGRLAEFTGSTTVYRLPTGLGPSFPLPRQAVSFIVVQR